MKLHAEALQLGARNWMFIGHVTAGADSALIRTLLENCRAHGLDPESIWRM